MRHPLTNMRSSANPAALLSSRLASYLKRPWSQTSPCPLEKELTTVHPRKVYYFLTTLPRQDFPDTPLDILPTVHAGGKGGRRIISPSISSASIDEETEDRKRSSLSPSPEVELSTEDLDFAESAVEGEFPHAPSRTNSSFSGRPSMARDGSNASSKNALSHNHKAASPPLEGDEREFTQTASSMRMRGMSLDSPIPKTIAEEVQEMEVEETEEEKAKRNREAAEALFGAHHAQVIPLAHTSSPLVKPLERLASEQPVKGESEDVEMKDSISILGGEGAGLTWETREPDNIQVEDLDDLFDAC